MEKETLRLLCKVNQLDLTEEQKDAFLSFMDERDADIKALDAIDTDGVEVMVHVMPIMTVVREDKVVKNFTREQLQEGAPETMDGYWQVPRVVE
jgi:aspartyl-tRNA(Asn)/glutamyl-tRNA(Gln) amidotransferase subunit C